jgi:hypothetical protein
MYIVSDKLAKVPMEIKRLGDKLPKSYQDFLVEYGIGTYCGFLRVKPDDQQLKEYTWEDFGGFNESIPIKKEQLEECITLMESIDGDIFAFHPKVNQLLLFPRHSVEISLCVMDEKDFFKTLNTAISYMFSGPILPAYFVPWNQRRHKFMRFKAGEFATIQELAKRYCELFPPDFLIEDEYACQAFRKQFGGCVTFAYSTHYITVVYDEDKSQQVEATLQFLGNM